MWGAKSMVTIATASINAIAIEKNDDDVNSVAVNQSINYDLRPSWISNRV